ncbi:hypothetical protein GMB86_00450 [Terrilactibacillus sp. BCM23-1]|uniref:Uncharacterized protein n=1 Tax=Terrilactibacillus tamarindi TaxID=2599694 RepID=A0A6N8CN17_9BACI|nr:hypothetical protein [Terrilactibacillus tamarindi]MTT30483.1 hypothetical protein [Terrilactibacillus tamarindi]
MIILLMLLFIFGFACIIYSITNILNNPRLPFRNVVQQKLVKKIKLIGVIGIIFVLFGWLLLRSG